MKGKAGGINIANMITVFKLMEKIGFEINVRSNFQLKAGTEPESIGIPLVCKIPAVALSFIAVLNFLRKPELAK